MDKKIESMSFEELLEEINKNNPETIIQAKENLYNKYLKRFDKEHEKKMTFIICTITIMVYIIFLFIMLSIV